jgi:hypothetical protein
LLCYIHTILLPLLYNLIHTYNIKFKESNVFQMMPQKWVILGTFWSLFRNIPVTLAATYFHTYIPTRKLI